MGTFNGSLVINSNLISSTQNALSVWGSGFSTPFCSKPECNLENEVRKSLRAIPGSIMLLSGGNKKCCTLGRQNSSRFTYNYEYLNGSSWTPHVQKLSNDIVCQISCSTLLVEMKFLWSKYFPFLTGSKKNLKYSCGRGYNVVSSTLNQPLNRTGYTDLGEGKLWMDILRLAQAETQFNASELYLLLFVDLAIKPPQLIKDTLDILNTTTAQYLYHGYKNFIYRSKAIDFEYNYQYIPWSNLNKCAYLVRIVP